ncbi:uncharacterized protein V6R79_005890 [Siganus canaliculatus]
MAAPGQIKSLLRHYLTELNEEMLREFQWCLGLDKRPIPWTLQDATREETVDTLVALYGEDDAAATTVDIFIDMRNHDLAVGLLKALEDLRNGEQHRAACAVFTPAASSTRATSSTRVTSSTTAASSTSGAFAPREAQRNPRNLDVPQDLTCSICLSLYTEPVVLQCGHSFCRTCLHQDWRGKMTRICPLCKKVLSNSEPPVNYTLKSLCESYRQRNQVEPE